MNLHKIYHPITATPYKYTNDYIEFKLYTPLKPYICCFWGLRNNAAKASTKIWNNPYNSTRNYSIKMSLLIWASAKY